MTEFFWGVAATGLAGAALFFLRFWRQTRDRLFAIFAAAFLLLAVGYAGLAAFRPGESRHYHYLLRLVAFAVIIGGIVDKNRRRS